MEKEIEQKILKAYEDGVKIRDIIKKYNLETSVSNFFNILPPVTYHDKCPYCDEEMTTKRKARSQIQNYDDSVFTCKLCGHKTGKCHCENCLGSAKNINKIGFEDKVYLATLCTLPTYDGFFCFGPIQNASLTPSKKWDIKIIKGLLKKGLITISNNTNEENLDEDDINDSTFEIKLSLDEIKAITNGDFFNIDDEEEKLEAKKIWHAINMHIINEYFIYELDLCDFTINDISTVTSVFFRLANDTSPAQALRIIDKSLEKTCKLVRQNFIEEEYAADNIIEQISYYINSGLAENWKSSFSSKPKFIKDSFIEIWFFYVLLKERRAFNKSIWLST